MRKKVAGLAAFLIALFLVTVPLAYMRWNDQRNGPPPEAGVVYRSAQMSPAQLKQAVAAYNIRTLINVQDE